MESNRWRRVFGLAGLAGLAAAHAGAATILFDDGLSHTVPGDPAFTAGDAIVLGASTQLLVGITQVDGESFLSNVDVGGGPALMSAATSNTRILGGVLRGGAADAVSDGTTPTSGLVTMAGAGIETFGRLDFPFGTVTGGATLASVSPAIDRVEANGGAGIVSRPGALSRVGAIEGVGGGSARAGGASGENLAYGGASIVAEGGTRLVLPRGRFEGGSAWADNGLSSIGSATAEGGPAVSVLASAVFAINGGEFTSGAARADAGFVAGTATATSGPALRIESGARGAIYGGDFSTGVATASANAATPPVFPPAAALRVDVGDGEGAGITLIGGRFRGDGAIEIPWTPAGGSGYVQIFYADLDSTGAVDLRLAHPGVRTILWANDVAVDGVPVVGDMITATAGTITGDGFLGGPIEWTFERLNDAPLEIVAPEPAGPLFPGVVTLVALVGRRRVRGTR
ncbi:MAG: hypothetical protein R3F21_12135 [Myxococcota bacterium]